MPSSRGEVQTWGSTPCAWRCVGCACEQLPAIVSMPRARCTRALVSARRAVRAVSKSSSPTLKTLRASFSAMNCRGVGSNVSGLAPSGTRTSTRKSSPTIVSTSVRSGAMVTNIVRAFGRSAVLQPVGATAVAASAPQIRRNARGYRRFIVVVSLCSAKIRILCRKRAGLFNPVYNLT